MCLKLTDLFEVVYPTNYSDDKVVELKQCIDNLNIDNIVNISSKKRENYFFVISETKDTLDFRISPIFEIIDTVKEINEIEESDYIIINDGINANNYENYNTNVNINLIDINDNHLINKLSIKKIVQEFNYPEELIGNFENDINDINTLNDFENEASEAEVAAAVLAEAGQVAEAAGQVAEAAVAEVSEVAAVEVAAVLAEVAEAEAEAEVLAEAGQFAEAGQDAAEAEDENVRTVQIRRYSYLDGFGFQIILNENNQFIVDSVIENGIVYNKLFVGDIIISINKFRALLNFN